MQHWENRQDRQSGYRTHCDCSWRLLEELVGSYWPVANFYSSYWVVWTVYPFWNIHVQDKGIDVCPTVVKNSFFLSQKRRFTMKKVAITIGVLVVTACFLSGSVAFADMPGADPDALWHYITKVSPY